MDIRNELIKDFVESLGLSNWSLVDECDIYIVIRDFNNGQLQIWQFFENIVVYNYDIKIGTYAKLQVKDKFGHKVKKWVLL